MSLLHLQPMFMPTRNIFLIVMVIGFLPFPTSAQEYCFLADTPDSEMVDQCFPNESDCNDAWQECSDSPNCYTVGTRCVNQDGTYEAPEAYEITERINNPIESTDFFALMHKLYRGVMMIIIPILVLFIVYSGFMFVSSQGNSEKLNKAKQNAKYATFGIAIILGAEIILSVVESFINALN